MTEQQPIKKGILSSLMGLFGEEESENGHEDEDQDEAAKPGDQVVRESYEPGWYRVSAAQEAPPTERSEGAHRWEPSPSAGPEQAAEPEWPGEPEGAEDPAPLFITGSTPTGHTSTEERAEEQLDSEAEVPEPLIEFVAVPEPVGEVPDPVVKPIEPAAPEPVAHVEPAWVPPAEEPEPAEVSLPEVSLPEVSLPEVSAPEASEPAVAIEESQREQPEAPVEDVAPATVEIAVEAPPPPEPEPRVESAPPPMAEEPAAEPDRAAARAGGSGLGSRVADDRRLALAELMDRGVRDEDVEALARLLQGPERDIRVLALRALGSRPDHVDPAAVRQALRDPTDEVRAAAVRLAAARATADVPEVFPVVAHRHWPAAQQAALETVPDLVARAGIGDTSLSAMLSAVGAMESQPGDAERRGLSALARAIGPDRLIGSLDLSDRRGLGAARLLVEEGSRQALRALAAHADDRDEEMRLLARSVAEQPGAEADVAHAEPEPPAEQPPAERHEPTAEDEVITGLARALEDPDEAVRTRARQALGTIGHRVVVAWARQALASADRQRATSGAGVAEAAELRELAPEVLRRGVTVPPDARGAFVRALSSFGSDPQDASNPSPAVASVDSVEPADRPEAVRLLWQAHGRQSLPHLRPLLEDSSAAVRRAVLEVFGESGDPAAIEVAQEMLARDSSPVVRATAIQVIGRTGLDQREASLAQALSDPDPDVRATAVEILPTGMGSQGAHLLLEAMADQDERVWQAAVRHLASLPERDRSVVWTAIQRCPASRREQLVATLEQTNAERLALLALDHLGSADYAERTLAIALAGRAGTPESIRGIVGALQDPAPSVRRNAAGALSGIRSAEAIPALERALYDPDVDVRMEAVHALSVTDDDNVLDPLITALKDPEIRVRDLAGEALVRWRSPGVARRLAAALSSPSLRRPAGEALARMGDAAVDPLVDILMDDDQDLAPTVGQLLDSLVGPDLFLERLGDMDPDNRLRAVEALGAIGGERGVDGLIRALSDPVESIRIRAVTLLGESGQARAFESVKRTFLGDPVLEVVAAAEDALRKLQPGAGGPPDPFDPR